MAAAAAAAYGAAKRYIGGGKGGHKYAGNGEPGISGHSAVVGQSAVGPVKASFSRGFTKEKALGVRRLCAAAAGDTDVCIWW